MAARKEKMSYREDAKASKVKTDDADEVREVQQELESSIREDSFSPPRKAKGKGRKGKKSKKAAIDVEDSEVLEDSKAKKSGKKKKAAIIDETTPAVPESSSSAQLSKENLEDELGKKDKDSDENVDNILIEETQETTKNTSEAVGVELELQQLQNGDEKKDSEKETSEDEINGKVDEKNDGDQDENGEKAPLRRKPTLSELQSSSIDAESSENIEVI